MRDIWLFLIMMQLVSMNCTLSSIERHIATSTISHVNQSP